MSDILLHYIVRVTPGTLAFAAFLYLIPERLKILRLFAFILLFIFLRDTMTPEGLWHITNSLEIRFVHSVSTLLFLGFASLALVALSHFSIGNLWYRRLWMTQPPANVVVLGLLSAIAISLLPVSARLVTGSPPSAKPDGAFLISAIFIFSFLGNLLEEVLFRGHLQNYFAENKLSQNQVILLSGITFAVCHVFLAFTITNIGWPILAFTLYEGLICAFLRARAGLLASVIAHGGGIFLIATGWV